MFILPNIYFTDLYSTNNLGEAQGTPLAEKIRYVAFDGFPKEGVSRESRGPLYQSRVAQIV